jgi:hypothetical protein
MNLSEVDTEKLRGQTCWYDILCCRLELPVKAALQLRRQHRRNGYLR